MVEILTCSPKDYVESRGIENYSLVGLVTEEHETREEAEGELVRLAEDRGCVAISDVRDVVSPAERGVGYNQFSPGAKVYSVIKRERSCYLRASGIINED